MRLLRHAARPVRLVDRRRGLLPRPHGHLGARVGGCGRPRGREPHGARHVAVGGGGGRGGEVVAVVLRAADGGRRLQGKLQCKDRILII